MPEKKSYALKSVEVALEGGVKVIADVDSFASVAELVADLEAAGFAQRVVEESGSPPVTTKRDANDSGDDPAAMIEMQADLPAGSLAKSKVLAIKDGVPQILQKSLFTTVTDAVLVLLCALEIGLKQNPVNYEDFSGLFESQNLKSGSPLSMLVTNLRHAGYIDKRTYADGRRLRLTAKGEAKAIEVLKRLATR